MIQLRPRLNAGHLDCTMSCPSQLRVRQSSRSTELGQHREPVGIIVYVIICIRIALAFLEASRHDVRGTISCPLAKNQPLTLDPNFGKRELAT